MPKEIIKEQLSPEARDSMGNPVGHSHKKPHVRDGRGKPFPNFTTASENRLKNNVTERRKKNHNKGNKI